MKGAELGANCSPSCEPKIDAFTVKSRVVKEAGSSRPSEGVASLEFGDLIIELPESDQLTTWVANANKSGQPEKTGTLVYLAPGLKTRLFFSNLVPVKLTQVPAAHAEGTHRVRLELSMSALSLSHS